MCATAKIPIPENKIRTDNRQGAAYPSGRTDIPDFPILHATINRRDGHNVDEYCLSNPKCKYMSMNTPPTTNSRCDFCEKKAIGMQILGCVSQNVCEDHAEQMLVEMKPGERKDWENAIISDMATKLIPVNEYSASGLAPVFGAHPSVLILGSYPSEQSLQRHEYYGNPRNQFWKIMGMVFSFPTDFIELPYQERLSILTGEGIAIWDVLEACSRKGSSDSSIADTIPPNDVQTFLKDHPSIHCIALNGKTGAGHWFKQYFSVLAEPKNEETGLVILSLPSTSPAYAGMGLNDKAEMWRRILPFCAMTK